MPKFRAEGREIFYSSDLDLVATFSPVPDYASALGIAKRVCALLNATDGLSLDEIERRLSATRHEKLGESE